MLNEFQVLELLRDTTKEYIKRLRSSDLYYMINEGEINAYLKTLNRGDLKVRFLDIKAAKILLKEVENILEGEK